MLVALPGVIPEQVEAVIEGNELVIGGTRGCLAEWRTAVIHRLELPQGHLFRAPYPFACRPALSTFTVQPAMACW